MTQQKERCVVCEAGAYETLKRVLAVETSDGETVQVPEVTVYRCNNCGDEVLPVHSHNYVDRFVENRAEQLTPSDVRSLFARLECNQAEAGELLGLGTKTLNRWLTGAQHPNRAMGFYLRVMAEFPIVLEWVRKRSWKKPADPKTNDVLSTSRNSTPNYACAFRRTEVAI